MLLLFTSYVCDYCDGVANQTYYSGFIVLRPERVGTGAPFYVFPTRTAAGVWRSANKLQHCQIREVLSLEPFEWSRSRGRLDVELARHPYQIFPDHKYPAGPHRAFIAPRGKTRAA